MQLFFSDPFKLDHNLAAGITEKVFRYIFQIFVNARNLNGISVNEINEDTMSFYFDVPYLKRGLNMPQDRLCKQCGKIGHTKKKCTEKEKRYRNEEKKVDANGTIDGQVGPCRNCGNLGHLTCLGNRSSEKHDLIICHGCGKPGHKRPQCPVVRSGKRIEQVPDEKKGAGAHDPNGKQRDKVNNYLPIRERLDQMNLAERKGGDDKIHPVNKGGAIKTQPHQHINNPEMGMKGNSQQAGERGKPEKGIGWRKEDQTNQGWLQKFKGKQELFRKNNGKK